MLIPRGIEARSGTDITGEVRVPVHLVGVLPERVIRAHALYNVMQIWGSTDVEMPRLNVELGHVLNAAAGRAELNQVVDDAISYQSCGDARRGRAVGVAGDGDMRVASSCSRAASIPVRKLASFVAPA